MERAIELAWGGWGRVHPNPMVGAVLVAGGIVIGEGFHAEYGSQHAEAAALASAGNRAEGATALVTLEPCAHQGKQPPCAEALIRAGVTRVVAALADPNPVAAGGAAHLRAAGITVDIGLCAREARAQNAIFLHAARKPGRPFVALKLATSVDARIADLEHGSKWLSGEPARDYVQWLRAGFDAIGVGGRTARADDPSLTVRGRLEPRVAPRRIVFSASTALAPQAALLRNAREIPLMIVTSPRAIDSAAGRDLAAAGVTLVPAESLDDGLHALGDRGITSLLVEGGGRLAGALLRIEAVDRLYWVQSPLWLGEQGIPAFAGVPSVPLSGAERWEPVERRALGADTLLVLDRPCSPVS